MQQIVKNRVIDSKENRGVTRFGDRRHACPGFFRMPMAQDGRICRIKLPLGNVTLQQLKEIARASQVYGNGIIEFTTRCNIQLRGITDKNQFALIDALLEAKLGPLAKTSDDIRNIMVSPTAGIDREALINTVQLAQQLLYFVQTNETYQHLSPKFSILINGGEATENNAHISDIWLSATADRKHFAVGLASCPLQIKQGKFPIGLIPEQMALSLIKTILDQFTSFSNKNTQIQRMRDVVKFGYIDEFIKAIRAAISSLKPWSPASFLGIDEGRSYIGLYPQNSDLFYLGVKPKPARLDYKQILQLAAVIEQRHHQTPLRLTSYQSVIIPDCSRVEAQEITRGLAKTGWVVGQSDPLSQLISCAGKPQCQAGLSNVKRDAVKLAELLGSSNLNTRVHLTACQKSCAANMPVAKTLLAVAEGRYNLYERSDKSESKFGRLVANNLDLCKAAELILKMPE